MPILIDHLNESQITAKIDAAMRGGTEVTFDPRQVAQLLHDGFRYREIKQQFQQAGFNRTAIVATVARLVGFWHALQLYGLNGETAPLPLYQLASQVASDWDHWAEQQVGPMPTEEQRRQLDALLADQEQWMFWAHGVLAVPDDEVPPEGTECRRRLSQWLAKLPAPASKPPDAP